MEKKVVEIVIVKLNQFGFKQKQTQILSKPQEYDTPIIYIYT